jgi:hypothetical protein
MRLGKRFDWAVAGLAAVGLMGAPVAPARFDSGGVGSGNGAGEKHGGPDGWRLGEPVRYENLTVFPVLSNSNADTGEFETLDQGLASGDVLVTEHGADEYLHRSRQGDVLPAPQRGGGAEVNRLVLINRGKKPVILLAGEIVSGGKQDRIVGKDRIVPVGGAPLPLDVFCVEEGRWTGGSAKFAAANTMVHPSVREKAAVDADQTKVWAAVRSGTVSTPRNSTAGSAATGGRAPSAVQPPATPAPRISAGAVNGVISSEAPSQSYRKIYQSQQIGRDVDTFADEMERRFASATAGLKDESVIGVVVAYGGEVAWSDVFASQELFRAYWPKLLRSYIVEALARPGTVEKASLEDGRTFLERLKGHIREDSEPGVYTWREIAQGHYAQIELEALAPSTLTLHWMKVLRNS